MKVITDLKKKKKENCDTGPFPALLLRLCVSTAGGKSLILDWGKKILHAVQWGQKKVKRKRKL